MYTKSSATDIPEFIILFYPSKGYDEERNTKDWGWFKRKG